MGGFDEADFVASCSKRIHQAFLRRKVVAALAHLERSSHPGCVSNAHGVGAARFDALKRRKLPLTSTDIDRDRGKPLSKYERNIIIFDWLYKVDGDPTAVTAAN